MSRPTHDPIEDPGTERLRRLLAQLDDSDFEWLDPPADLWDRIVDAIDAGPPVGSTRPDLAVDGPPAISGGAAVIEYTIDCDDVLIAVDQAWASFARENQAPELVTPSSGRTLWSYLDDDDLRGLWRHLVSDVRARRTEVAIPFRCDAPEVRRWFEMNVAAADDGSVRFRSVLHHEEARPTVPLLDRDADRDLDADPVRLCSWCGQGSDGAHWHSVERLTRDLRLLERAQLPPISYGICPTCREVMAAVIAALADAAGPRPR